jgi:hypothetical protein
VSWDLGFLGLLYEIVWVCVYIPRYVVYVHLTFLPYHDAPTMGCITVIPGMQPYHTTPQREVSTRSDT